MRKARYKTSSQNPAVIPTKRAEARWNPKGGKKAFKIGTFIRGRKRKSFATESAPTPSAIAHAAQRPTRQTPKSLNDDPRRRSSSQSAPTKHHSSIATLAIFHQKRC